MARIRSIKPEFWTDEKVVSLSPLARLLFIGMWNFVDDYGRGSFSPRRLKMQILPADDADMSALLGEIRREMLIEVYVHEDKEYFEVCGFTKHQKVDKRVESKLPSPPTSPYFPRIPSADQGKDQGKEDIIDVSAREIPNDVSKDEEGELFAVAGKALSASPNLLVMAEPMRWKAGGMDWLQDVIPAVRTLAQTCRPGSVQSWKYFSQAIADWHAKRTAPMPAGNPRDGPGYSNKPIPPAQAAYDALERLKTGSKPFDSESDLQSGAAVEIGDYRRVG